MSEFCPVSGKKCIRASICEGYDDSERIIDLIISSPETQIMKEVLSKDELAELMTPVLQAWGSEGCYRDRVQALRDLQSQDGISHVSMSMGIGAVAQIEKTQLEL